MEMVIGNEAIGVSIAVSAYEVILIKAQQLYAIDRKLLYFT